MVDDIERTNESAAQSELTDTDVEELTRAVDAAAIDRAHEDPRDAKKTSSRPGRFSRPHSVDTIVVCGCNFPNDPRTTIYEASERGYRLVFVRDATSGVYERARRALENIGVAVEQTADVEGWMGGSEHVSN